MKLNRRHFLKLSSASALCSVVNPLLASTENTEKMPTLFVGHGSPMNAIEENEFSLSWRRLGQTLPKPKTILVVSAHWLSRGGTFITANEKPPIIYDMYGFPEALYQVTYPANGNVALATDISQDVLTPNQHSPNVTLTSEWGLDHGTWSVLTHMYPNADIPVLQLSLNYYMPLHEHMQLAQQLRYLREKGVLILTSGNLVHNLRMVRNGDAYPWAQEFQYIITNAVEQRDFEKVIEFQKLGQLAQLAHPTYDHFLPLIYTLGAADKKENLFWFNKKVVRGTLDMSCLLVGDSLDYSPFIG